MRKLLAALALCLACCLGLAATARAASSASVTITKTSIQTDSVFNTSGYGSISTKEAWDSSHTKLTKLPQSALIDRNGTFVFNYKDTWHNYYYENGIVALTTGDPYVLRDLNGKIDKPGHFTLDGNPVGSLDYFGVTPFAGDYAFAITLKESADAKNPSDIKEKDIGACGLVDKSGKLVLSLGEDFVDYSFSGWGPSQNLLSATRMATWYSDGLLGTCSPRNKTIDYLDASGASKLHLSLNDYPAFASFFDGFAKVWAESGTWGYINKQGKVAISCQYSDASNFINGYAAVCSGGKWGYIDKSGKTSIPFQYEAAYGYGDGLFAVKKGGKFGLVDASNQVAVPFEYDDISSYEGGVAYAIKDGRVCIISGYKASAPAPAPTPSVTRVQMYRLYNPNSGEHFYTAKTQERDGLKAAGWTYEGPAWIAPSTSSTPVYRMYSGTDHHYCTDPGERDALKAAGWTYEGIGWYSDDAKGVPLYRQFNPNVDPSAPTNNSGSHNYTTDKSENDALVKMGWRAEGIGWYGMK